MNPYKKYTKEIKIFTREEIEMLIEIKKNSSYNIKCNDCPVRHGCDTRSIDGCKLRAKETLLDIMTEPNAYYERKYGVY